MKTFLTPATLLILAALAPYRPGLMCEVNPQCPKHHMASKYEGVSANGKGAYWCDKGHWFEVKCERVGFRKAGR